MLKKRDNKSQSKKPRNLFTISDKYKFVAEQFRAIRVNINFIIEKEIRVIAVTSSVPGEGKSTIASNLAVVIAQEGKKVLLIDADLRKPTIHYTFNKMNLLGLSDVLMGTYDLHNVIFETPMPNLDILTSGNTLNPSELFITDQFEQLLSIVKNKYDLIIVDAPPVLAVPEAQIISNKCDGTLMIVNSGVTKKKDFKKSEKILTTAKSKIIGIILNNFKAPNDPYEYYSNYKSNNL